MSSSGSGSYGKYNSRKRESRKNKSEAIDQTFFFVIRLDSLFFSLVWLSLVSFRTVNIDRKVGNFSFVVAVVVDDCVMHFVHVMRSNALCYAALC